MRLLKSVSARIIAREIVTAIANDPVGVVEVTRELFDADQRAEHQGEDRRGELNMQDSARWVGLLNPYFSFSNRFRDAARARGARTHESGACRLPEVTDTDRFDRCLGSEARVVPLSYAR